MDQTRFEEHGRFVENTNRVSLQLRRRFRRPCRDYRRRKNEVISRDELASFQLGGKLPDWARMSRSLTRSSELILSTCVVTIPHFVLPSSTALLQRKWRFHCCSRGLNSGTVSFPNRPARFAPLARLQLWQLHARFEGSSLPPCLRGMMCSRWKAYSSSSSWMRQYSQRLFARLRTSHRVLELIKRSSRG